MITKNNINLHILNASGKLTPYIKKIKNIFDKAVIKIVNKIPVSDIDVVIVDDPLQSIPEIGMGGYTMTPNFVKISFDVGFNNFNNVLSLELMDSIAHEFHHVVRWRAVGYGETLLKALTSEGLADHFAIEMTRRKDLHPWNKAFNQEQISGWLRRAKNEFNSKNYSHTDWFFGSKEKGIPRWTGYTLGYNLVAEYLKKNPNKKSSRLYALPAEEFIK